MIMPGLVTGVLESYSLQKAGGGSYMRGSRRFVVVVGVFDNDVKVAEVMNTFLAEELGRDQFAVVFLARNEPSQNVMGLLKQSLYRHRVEFFHGSAMVCSFLGAFRIGCGF